MLWLSRPSSAPKLRIWRQFHGTHPPRAAQHVIHVRNLGKRGPLFAAPRVQRYAFFFLSFSVFFWLSDRYLPDDDDDGAPPDAESTSEAGRATTAPADLDPAGPEVDPAHRKGTDSEIVSEDDDMQQGTMNSHESAPFVPLGFPRPGPVSYYKGSDPEWRAFCHFNEDREAQVAARSMPHVLSLN